MMQRIPEPELMNDPEQAKAYAEADFSEANQLFLALFEQNFPGHVPRQVVDLGCGPGEITLAFAGRHSSCRITGIDGAPAMLNIARQRLRHHSALASRVSFHCARLPIPDPAPSYDTLLSNSLLHHLSDPLTLWQQIRAWGKPGGAVVVMDLKRPPSKEAAKQIVATHAAGAPDVLQRDFYNSLCAAFTEDEVRQQLKHSGLEDFQVHTVSDRHLAVVGQVK